MANSSEPIRKKQSRAARKRNQLNIQSIHPPKQIKKTPSRAAKKAAQAAATLRPVKINTKRRNVITIASIALVVAIIAGLGYYLFAVLPMQTTILTVNNDNISTGYFLKRVVANPNGDVSSTLQLLEVELIIKQQAAANGVAPVTDQAIDAYLREEANSELSSNTTTDSTTTTSSTTTPTTTPTNSTTTTGSTTTPTTTPTITDAEFNKWFKEQLANTGLSAKEYREVAGDEIRQQRLTDILSADIPSSMPQIHLWAIDFDSNSAALAAKAKIDGGTDFATVANTIAGQTDGGDMGWMPLAVIPTALETAASTLDVGKCSDPVEYTQSDSSSSSGTTTSYVLLMISEKSDDMPVTADQLVSLKNNVLNNWLNTQSSSTKITFHGLNGSTTLDTQTLTWLNYKVAKLVKKRPTETSTTLSATTTSETTTPTTTESISTTPSTTTTNSTSP